MKLQYVSLPFYRTSPFCGWLLRAPAGEHDCGWRLGGRVFFVVAHHIRRKASSLSLIQMNRAVSWTKTMMSAPRSASLSYQRLAQGARAILQALGSQSQRCSDFVGFANRRVKRRRDALVLDHDGEACDGLDRPGDQPRHEERQAESQQCERDGDAGHRPEISDERRPGDRCRHVGGDQPTLLGLHRGGANGRRPRRWS